MSQRSCEGLIALVTGASKGGTGTAIALRLAAEGALRGDHRPQRSTVWRPHDPAFST